MPVRVDYRCPLRWESLARTADAARRHCGACGRDVTDLSALTRDEARRVLVAEERPCVRVAVDPEGEPVFARVARRVAAVLMPVLVASSSALAEEPAVPAPTAPSTPHPPAASVPAEPADAQARVIDTRDTDTYIVGLIYVGLEHPEPTIRPTPAALPVGPFLLHRWTPPQPEKP
jgi:hypothetical protein